MTAPARWSIPSGAWRRARPCALALVGLASSGACRAQFAGVLGVDSVNRYRGVGTDDRGPVLRASVVADVTGGFANGVYAGVSGLWRVRDASFASADLLAGWSGRLAALPGLASLAPGWGWDTGLHRRHYAEGSRYDFTEAMAGLLAPGWALHAWYSPHYFGGPVHTLYTELNGSLDLDDHWHVFGHAGYLHYGPAGDGRPRIGDRTDVLAGFGYAVGAWDFRLSRDGIVTGAARSDLEARQRSGAWILGASVAF